MRFEILWNMDFWHKGYRYLFDGIEMQEISRNFVKFRNISRYEISRNKKNYFAK
jgi:hypothetical protein